MAIGEKVKKALEAKEALAAAEAAEASAEAPSVATHEAASSDLDGAKVLAEAIVGAINANQPRRQVPYGRHRQTSVWDNKDGSPKPPLLRRCFQNGRMIFDHTVNSTEIELLNRLKPGRFVEGLITITVHMDPNGETLNIVYNCKTADQRMAIGSKVGSFKGLLKRCLREALAQEEAEKARIRELARSRPKKVELDDLLKPDDDDLIPAAADDDDNFDV